MTNSLFSTIISTKIYCLKYLFVIAVLQLAFVSALFAAPGDLDPTFGIGGTTLTQFTVESDDAGGACGIQPDGKTLIASTTDSNQSKTVLVNCYNIDGTADPSFGNNGITYLNLGKTNSLEVENVFVQSDNKIVVGFTAQSGNQTPVTVFSRLNSNGSLDNTFGTNGIKIINFSSQLIDFVVLPNNKIVFIGNIVGVQAADFVSYQLTDLGELDPGFGINGRVITDIGVNTSDYAGSIVLQSNGKILIVGSTNSQIPNFTPVISIVRYNSNGNPDIDFNGTGKKTISVGSEIRLLNVVKALLQNSGKIVIVGQAQIGNLEVLMSARIDSGGSLDLSFGTNGISIVTFVNSANLRGVEKQSNDKIVLTGDFTGDDSETDTFDVFRITANGQTDVSFGNNGLVSIRFAEYGDESANISVGSDDKLTVAGLSFTGLDDDIAVTRLKANGTLDTDFDLDGKITENIGITEKGFGDSKLEILPDGKFIVAATLGAGRNYFEILVLSRFNSNGTIDTSFGNNGFVTFLPPLFDNFYFSEMLLQTDGKILIIGANLYIESERNIVARFNNDGTFDATFGNNGKVILTLENSRLGINGAKLQPDGKIIISGNIFGTRNEAVVFRLNSNGSLDTSFAGDGIFTTTLAMSAFDINLQPNGKILFSGMISNVSTNNPFDAVILRIDSNGSIDTSFGINGRIVVDFFSVDNPKDLQILPDGKILFLESMYVNNEPITYLSRYDATGQPDVTFDNDGHILISNFNGIEFRIDQIGRIVVAGSSIVKILNQTDFAVIRINSNGGLDSSFGINGRVLTDFGKSSYDYASDILIQPNGKIVVGGTGGSNSALILVRYLGDSSMSITPVKFDFDGDGKSDVSVFRPSQGVWYVSKSSDGSVTGSQWGIATDKIVPADYNGDGKTDYAVFRAGFWYILYNGGGFEGFQWGNAGDIPFPADFDADGKADLAVFRNGTWFVRKSSGGTITQGWGSTGDIPVVADYDADGKADFAVYRNGIWYVLKSTGGDTAVQWGIAGDKTVQSDYNGDGKADYAVFRDGFWYVLLNGGGFIGAQWGTTGDLPAPADYDGDGKTDLAVFRSGIWYIQRTTAGVQVVNFGSAGDKPVANAFVP